MKKNQKHIPLLGPFSVVPSHYDKKFTLKTNAKAPRPYYYIATVDEIDTAIMLKELFDANPGVLDIHHPMRGSKVIAKNGSLRQTGTIWSETVDGKKWIVNPDDPAVTLKYWDKTYCEILK